MQSPASFRSNNAAQSPDTNGNNKFASFTSGASYGNKAAPPAAASCSRDPQEDEESMLTCIPVLSQQFSENYSGPHTQFAAEVYCTLPNGTNAPRIISVTCTQIFICDDKSFVQRVILMEKLLTIYHRAPPGQPVEILICVDGEHDLLITSKNTSTRSILCDAPPQSSSAPKPLIPTLKALHKQHHPTAPLIIHMDCPAPLREMAKLKPDSGYVAPLPCKEELFENCPCWRTGDVLNISNEEFQRRVRNIFTVHAPAKLSTVQELCRKYQRKKGGALQWLVAKYGPEPSEEHAASVAMLTARDQNWAELFPSGQQQPDDSDGGQQHLGGTKRPLSSVFGAQKTKNVSENPLMYSTLIIAKRPTGGMPKVTLRISPVTELLPPEGFRMFKRRPMEVDTEFWYLTNEGFVLAFDIGSDAMHRFGFAHGDRVLSTFGVTSGRWSTVVGVREGALWVHDEGELGASALVGFSNRDELERANGWMWSDSVRLPETRTMLVMTTAGYTETVNITPETVYDQYGFYHGEYVGSLLPSMNPTPNCVILGVNKHGVLFVQFDEGGGGDQHNASSSSGRGDSGTPSKPRSRHDVDLELSRAIATNTSPSSALQQPHQNSPRSRTAIQDPRAGGTAKRAVAIEGARTKEELVRRHGWKSLGSVKVIQWSSSSSSC